MASNPEDDSMMANTPVSSLKAHFGELHDPRAQHTIDHLLLDIVVLTICAVICGADSWPEVENYGIVKQEWLSTFFELPQGIPSHDTIERLFARLRPAELQQFPIHRRILDFTNRSYFYSTLRELISSNR